MNLISDDMLNQLDQELLAVDWKALGDVKSKLAVGLSGVVDLLNELGKEKGSIIGDFLKLLDKEEAGQRDTLLRYISKFIYKCIHGPVAFPGWS